MGNFRPIETFYNGYKFRSRLEARWSIFFDSLNIKYEYEPEGFVLSDGTRYLPDFYLPQSDSFFEVKGIMTDIDKHKVEQFIRDIGKPVTIGYGDMTFQACDNWGSDGYELTDSDSSHLCRCYQCNNYFFMGNGGSYQCPCCGYYDGDSTAEWCAEGHLIDRDQYITNDVYQAFLKSKQARFEHGETPINIKYIY